MKRLNVNQQVARKLEEDRDSPDPSANRFYVSPCCDIQYGQPFCALLSTFPRVGIRHSYLYVIQLHCEHNE